MIIQRIKDFTRVFGAPAGHDNNVEEVHIGSLWIRDIEMYGMPFMVSSWQPTPDELRAIQQGAPILLMISGNTHPVVALQVGELSD